LGFFDGGLEGYRKVSLSGNDMITPRGKLMVTVTQADALLGKVYFNG